MQGGEIKVPIIDCEAKKDVVTSLLFSVSSSIRQSGWINKCSICDMQLLSPLLPQSSMENQSQPKFGRPEICTIWRTPLRKRIQNYKYKNSVWK